MDDANAIGGAKCGLAKKTGKSITAGLMNIDVGAKKTSRHTICESVRSV